MFKVRDIDHVVLRVKDLERMVTFYCETLGCSVARRRPELGLVHLRAGSALIDLVPVEGPLGLKGGAAPGREARNMDHLCLRVEPFDVETIVRHLESCRARVGEIAERFGAQGVGMSVYVYDPEDNLVELKGYAGGSAA